MVSLPPRRTPAETVLDSMRRARDNDARWQDGKTWSLVFHAGDEVNRLLKDAYAMFFSENGLNPMAFPSLKKFEAEVVSMTAHLLGGDDQTAGNMTSGGTESLLMAVKTARDWARATRPHITHPEMLMPSSAHPAIEKAAHYFGLKSVRVPVDANFQADIPAMRAAITPNTILLIGSAPSYPQGMVDPIPKLAALAQEHDLLCHVDACVGGFILPFVRRLGRPVPDFDFSVPGVTSISVDLHKYGYAAKGASVILYRTAALRRHQFFIFTDWAGGIYASPAMAGTRPGGAIAAAWAVMNFLGEEGYLEITGDVMRTVDTLRQGINAIDGLRVLGDPPMSILSIGSDTLNVFEVGDEMSMLGWHLDRQQAPPSLHLTVTPAHAAIAEQFLADLATAARRAGRISVPRLVNAAQVKLARWAARRLPPRVMSALTAQSAKLGGLGGDGEGGRTAAMYGMMATLPNRGDIDELVLGVLEGFTRVSDSDR